MNNNNNPPDGPPKVNPPLGAPTGVPTEAPTESAAPMVNPPMGAAPGVPDSEKPPAVSSEKIREMVEAGFRANRADYESDEVDLSGAGPQPLDDSAFGSDD